MASETLALFLERLHDGGEWAYLWTKEGLRSFWYPVGKPLPTVNGPARNVYFGVHTTAEIPPTNAKGEIVKPDKVRSQVDYVDAINCLFAEFDGKDFVPDMARRRPGTNPSIYSRHTEQEQRPNRPFGKPFRLPKISNYVKSWAKNK